MQLADLRERLKWRREKPRMVTSLFLLIMLATFAYFVSVGTLIPTLPRYVKGPLGGGELAVGVVIGSFALSAVMLRPFIGGVGDRRGRRALIIGGAAVVAVSVAAYALTSSLLVLVGLRLFSGVGEAAFYVGAASVINDIAPDERRGEALSYFSLALYGGLAVGPVLGETVLGDGRYSLTWLVAASAAAIASIIGFSVTETRSERPPQSARRRIVHPAGLIPGIVLACSVVGLAGYTTFMPLYALDLGLQGSREIFVVYSVIILLIRSVGARIPDKLGAVRSARFALTTSALGLALVAMWGTTVGLYTGTVLFSVGQALTFPALMTVAVRNAPASERGAVVGTFTAFFDLAFGAGAVTLGGVAEVFGYRGSFAVASAVAAAGFALLVVRARRFEAAESDDSARAA